MTPKIIIDLTRELKPSVFSDSALLSFLNEVEKTIYTIMGFEDNLTKANRYLTVKKCEYTEGGEDGALPIFSGTVCTVNEPITIDDANVLNTFMHVGNPESEGDTPPAPPVIPRPVFFNSTSTFIVQVTPGTAGNATVRLDMQVPDDSQYRIILPYLFKGYTNLETASNVNVLLPDVYKYIYAYYIASQIDYYSNDIPSYNNNMTLYNNAIADFAKRLNGRRTVSKRYNYNYEGAFRK